MNKFATKRRISVLMLILLLALAFIGAGGGFVSALMNTVFRALLTLVGL